jgi:hypothetical protein
MTGEERQPTTQMDLTIIIMGEDTAPIKKFIDDAVVHCMQAENDNINIYELHRWGLGWTKVQSKKPRTLDSVVLDKGLSDMLCKDIK